MAPRKTRAIGIFANSACVASLTLRKSDRPLLPKADISAPESIDGICESNIVDLTQVAGPPSVVDAVAIGQLEYE